MEEVVYKIDGQKITGHVIYPTTIQEKHPAILFIHGWLSNERGYIIRAKALAELGFIGMTINLRGQGKSEGDLNVLSRNDFTNDIVTAYDFLGKHKHVDATNISVVGASFGAYLGTMLSTKRNVKNLVLRVPANYPDQDANIPHIHATSHKNPEVANWRKQKLTPKDSLALEAISKYHNPVLIIESENDTVIPHQAVQNYIDSISETSLLTYKFMEKTSHNLETESQQKEFIDILKEWFENKSSYVY